MLAIQWLYYHTRDNSDLLKEYVLCDGNIAGSYCILLQKAILAEAGFTVDEFFVI